ncbi:hypothetical protein cgR_0200 [Corynebacterium glutamicum R]|uniref:Uncharacterized protein n=1 Tax=Corynebacterium glutamicum (strain R) TaxID=340322 RepID=A0AB72V793_CORGB|nr:hypothetical protein cgR_0200 [Corynebacterium glutamicum R]
MNHPETATVLRSISDMVSTETNPRRKSRLEQLIYTTASAWPHYPIAHAAQAAVQLARPMRVFELQSFEGVKHALHHIDLRPALDCHAGQRLVPVSRRQASWSRCVRGNRHVPWPRVLPSCPPGMVDNLRISGR